MCVAVLMRIGINFLYVTFRHFFQVIASEDWQGTRPDYKVTSDEASFRVDYTPKVEM